MTFWPIYEVNWFVVILVNRTTSLCDRRYSLNTKYPKTRQATDITKYKGGGAKSGLTMMEINV